MDKIRKENVFRYSPSVYYTSLRESEDRRKHMQKQLDDWGIAKHEPFIVDRFTEKTDIHFTGPHTENLSNGEKGTLSSHLLSIYHWYHNTDERYAMFCEDDISFDTVKYWEFYWEDFMLSLPRDWKMVQVLRINPFNSMDYQENSGLQIRKRNWCDWGCHYIINRKAAEELLSLTVKDEKHIHLEPQYNLHPMPENSLFMHFTDCIDTVYSVPLFVENVEFETTFTDKELDPATGAKLDQYESSVFYHNLWKDVGRNFSIDDIMNVKMPTYQYVVNKSRKVKLDETPLDK